jgi:transposase
MYLLEGEPAPDHNTIARFRSWYLRDAMEDLFSQFVNILAGEGELSLLEIFLFRRKRAAGVH